MKPEHLSEFKLIIHLNSISSPHIYLWVTNQDYFGEEKYHCTITMKYFGVESVIALSGWWGEVGSSEVFVALHRAGLGCCVVGWCEVNAALMATSLRKPLLIWMHIDLADTRQVLDCSPPLETYHVHTGHKNRANTNSGLTYWPKHKAATISNKW